jgi:hypothetical protein
MFGVTTLLKSLGVNVTDEHIKQLEILLPQLPAKAQEVIKFNVEKWQQMDARLAQLEHRATNAESEHAELLEKMEEILNVTKQWSDKGPCDSPTGAVAGIDRHGRTASTRVVGGRRNGHAGGKH